MKNHFQKIIMALLFVLPVTVFSQIKIPAASPASTIKQTIGLTDITIDYSRPQLKGRSMFEDLTREGEVWRTGANMSTKITFSDEVKLNGNVVPAGTYSIYSIPGKENWTIIINKKISWGTQYDKSEDLLRFDVKRQELPIKYETFTFFFGRITENSCSVGFLWENSRVAMELTTEVASKVMAQIKEVMGPSGNPTDGDYYSAASYYMNNDKNMDKALEWINHYIEKTPKAYWGYRLKAQVLAKKGMFAEAIQLANKSTELATEAGNKDYIHNNGKSIEEWKKNL